MILKNFQLSLCLFLLFFSVINFTWNRLLFFPLILEPKSSKHCYETYFSNDMGGYIWKPIHQNPLGEKTLFYFNDTTGNCSTRFVIVRDIHRNYFPNYTIVQLEYPGFGISTHLPLELDNIIGQCTSVVINFLRQYTVRESVFWGEGMGSFIMSQVIPKTPALPNQIVFHNGVNNLSSYLFSKFKFFMAPFFLFSKKWKHSSDYMKTNRFPTTYKIITTQNPVHQHQSFDFYFEMPDENVHFLELEGNGSYGILFEKNRVLLDNLFLPK